MLLVSSLVHSVDKLRGLWIRIVHGKMNDQRLISVYNSSAVHSGCITDCNISFQSTVYSRHQF